MSEPCVYKAQLHTYKVGNYLSYLSVNLYIFFISIFFQLQKHDSEIDLELRTNLRTEESMEAEANELRLHFS